MTRKAPVLEVRDLECMVRAPAGELPAVRGVSFSVDDGECLGIVGESGSGKTMTCLGFAGLLQRPRWVSGGQALFNGRDLISLAQNELDELRGRDLSMVFQDPLSSLNPVWTIGTQMMDVIRRHTSASRSEAAERAVACLEQVGVPAARERLRQYPFQLSGGLRQRVMIAMALSCEPILVVADEPTTALDVSVQAQLLDLLADLKARANFSLVLVTHDLGVAAYLCDRIVVMYGGKVVEAAPAHVLLNRPRHPYTRALIDSSLIDPDHPDRLRPIAGTPPTVDGMPAGCPFNPRCPRASDRCRCEMPDLVPDCDVRQLACFHPVDGLS